MSAELHAIGRCDGCDRVAELEEGVCRACLEHPRRGRRWARLSRLCRTDPAVAWKVLSMIRTEGGRRLFLREYGSVFSARAVAPPTEPEEDASRR